MHAHLIDEMAVRAWMDAYRSAWTERDADVLVRLFAADACYQERRYKPTLHGIEAICQYWRTTIEAQQGDIAFDYGVVALRANTACIHWRAAFTPKSSGRITEVDALSRISFSVDRGRHGLVAYAWDEWVDTREAETTRTAIGRSLRAL
jgi:ketosteroid isomerase-like protein